MGATPFEVHFGRKPTSILNNLLDLENESRGIIQNIYDVDGNHLAQNQFEGDAIKKMVFNRSYGKSASVTDIVKEMQKRKLRPKIQFFVTKNHKKKRFQSSFETTPRMASKETDHTASDGKTVFHKKDIADVTNVLLNNINRFPHLQGLIQFHTRYKEVPRDLKGRFTQPENATRVDMAPVRAKPKGSGKGKKKDSALEIAELDALLNLTDTDEDQPIVKRKRTVDISKLPPPPTGPQGLLPAKHGPTRE